MVANGLLRLPACCVPSINRSLWYPALLPGPSLAAGMQGTQLGGCILAEDPCGQAPAPMEGALLLPDSVPALGAEKKAPEVRAMEVTILVGASEAAGIGRHFASVFPVCAYKV